MSVSEEIKSRLDIVDIVGEHVRLRKSGNSYTGFCPFHSNSRTPAFVVFPNSQTWRCFGACAEGGDIFAFVMKKEGWEFKEALAHLAQRAGVTLEDRRLDKAQQEEAEKLGDLLAAAADYFHQLLLYAPQAEVARRYVTKRSFTPETVETFKIGFTLDSWDACRTHFNMQGYSDEDLVDAGLLTENQEKGTRYDRFRNRLMIPIRDVNGRIVGFGARTLDPDGIPKYLNSPQTTLFDKSRLLYGLDLARRHIREARQAVIVEGYMDVIQAYQAGFSNVVAQMGTALTGEQLALLKRYTRRFVIALDADAAGAQATLRSLQVARESLDRETDRRFDARGLVRHEGRLQADIRIASLPPDKDPDNVIRADPAAWDRLVGQARPVVEYVIKVATEDLDLKDAKAKTAVAQQILPLISDVADPIEREHYRQLLARTLRVDERALRQVALPAPPARRTVAAKSGPVRAVSAQAASPDLPNGRTSGSAAGRALISRPIDIRLREANYLRQCLCYPQLVAQVNQKLQQQNQQAVNEADFSAVEDRAIWRQIRQRLNNTSVVTSADLCDSLRDKALQDRLGFLLNLPEDPESELDRLPDSLVLSILDCRGEKVRELISAVEQLFNDRDSQADPETLSVYRQELVKLNGALASFKKARSAMSATNRRLAEETARHSQVAKGNG
jgi:DNA primase